MVYPYIPHTDEDREMMMQAIGIQSLEELYGDLGEDILLSDSVPISQGRSEDEVIRMVESIANRNERGIPFLGSGCYDHIIPSTVDAIASLPSFVTSYTPYQAEMSQGMLQVIYEFQSMTCAVTSYVSLLDAQAADIVVSGLGAVGSFSTKGELSSILADLCGKGEAVRYGHSLIVPGKQLQDKNSMVGMALKAARSAWRHAFRRFLPAS